MKKFIWILLIVCLVLGCIIFFVSKNGSGSIVEPVSLYDPENVSAQSGTNASGGADATAQQGSSAASAASGQEGVSSSAVAGDETIRVSLLDYDKLLALHAPEDVVGSVDGRPVTWDEYFYWLHNWGTEAESYIQMLALYGQSLGWNDKLSSDSDETLADYVLELANDYTRQFNVIEAVAAENGVTLTSEDEEALAAQLQETIISACGEGATEEDFDALLKENYISRAMYDRVSSSERLVDNTFAALYGERGEKISDAAALGYLEDNGYLCASHILFMTIDPDTYEELDAETVAQKKQQAEAVYAELLAIEDPEERLQRFAELKEQYCEDSGKAVYPDGYLFTSGSMVEEFENAVLALAANEISEPVKSFYGYHVILRLPLDADMTMSYADDGTPMTARSTYAEEQFSAMMTARVEESALTLNDDVAAIKLTDYLRDAE